jgi:hypothetical protein
MNKKAVASLIVTFALIFVYYQLWNRYAINIPKWDDHALKATVLNFEKADSFGAKVYEIYRQHNEHRIALTRLITILDYKIFGRIDYEHLMFFGNLALLLIWWLLTRFFKPLAGAVWYALPIATFWFSLAFWENAFWGMAAIQNIWVVAWAMLTFWRLSRVDKYWWWALPTAFMGIFTSGNGILIFPLAFGILLLQKRWQISVIWFAFSVFCIVLYFLDYQRPPTDLSASGGFKALIHSYVLFCGSLVEGLPFGNFPFQMPIWIGRLTLFVSLSMLLYILRSYWKRNFVLDTFDYFYLGGVLFALATGLIVAYSRTGLGAEIMLTSRYKLYSALLLSFNIAYLTRLVSATFREVLTLTFVVAAGYLYACNQHYHLYDAIQLRKFNISSSFNWRNEGPVSGTIYQVPRLFLEDIAIPKDSLLTGKPCKIVKNTLTLSQPDYRLYDLRDGGLYLVLSNAQHQYVFPTWQARKHSFRNVFNYNRYFIKGSTAIIPTNEVTAGKYQVRWLHYDRQGKLYFENAECDVVTFEKTEKQNIKTNW